MWKKITEKEFFHPDQESELPFDDTWILVRNSQGFYAAVNQISVNTKDNLIRGYSVTPEEEKLLISDEVLEWMEIDT